MNRQFKLYPNPTINNMFLSFDIEKTNKEISISIFDLSGRNVYNDKFAGVMNGDKHVIPMNELSQGYYVVSLNVDGAIYVGKIIKQ
jgi:hypothetical protein